MSAHCSGFAMSRRRGAFEPAPLELVAQRAVLQIPPHRNTTTSTESSAVHGARLRPQQPVLPRPARRLASPALTPRAYASRHCALLGRGFASPAARAARKSKRRARTVLLQRDRAEQLRQLAGREAARQIHLEEAILRVHEAGAVREVGARCGGDGGVPSASRAIVTGRRGPAHRSRRRAAAASSAAPTTQTAKRQQRP